MPVPIKNYSKYKFYENNKFTIYNNFLLIDNIKYL